MPKETQQETLKRLVGIFEEEKEYDNEEARDFFSWYQEGALEKTRKRWDGLTKRKRRYLADMNAYFDARRHQLTIQFQLVNRQQQLFQAKVDKYNILPEEVERALDAIDIKRTCSAAIRFLNRSRTGPATFKARTMVLEHMKRFLPKDDPRVRGFPKSIGIHWVDSPMMEDIAMEELELVREEDANVIQQLDVFDEAKHFYAAYNRSISTPSQRRCAIRDAKERITTLDGLFAAYRGIKKKQQALQKKLDSYIEHKWRVHHRVKQWSDDHTFLSASWQGDSRENIE